MISHSDEYKTDKVLENLAHGRALDAAKRLFRNCRNGRVLGGCVPAGKGVPRKYLTRGRGRCLPRERRCRCGNADRSRCRHGNASASVHNGFAGAATFRAVLDRACSANRRHSLSPQKAQQGYPLPLPSVGRLPYSRPSNTLTPRTASAMGSMSHS